MKVNIFKIFIVVLLGSLVTIQLWSIRERKKCWNDSFSLVAKPEYAFGDIEETYKICIRNKGLE